MWDYMRSSAASPLLGVFWRRRVGLASGLLPDLYSLDIREGLAGAVSPGMIFGDRRNFDDVVRDALRAGLLIAIHEACWNEIGIESDCAVLIHSMAREEGDVTEVSTILLDCHHYLEAFDIVIFRHVYREANGL
ncbi:hypothetical protein ACLB2K_006851 [Fragaria x ananassa]